MVEPNGSSWSVGQVPAQFLMEDELSAPTPGSLPVMPQSIPKHCGSLKVFLHLFPVTTRCQQELGCTSCDTGCIYLLDVSSSDLSELCGIFNFRLFAGTWDKDYSPSLKCQSQHFASLWEIWILKTLGCPKGYFHNYTLKNYLKVLLHLSYTRHYSPVARSEILIQCMLEEMTVIPGVTCSIEK